MTVSANLIKNVAYFLSLRCNNKKRDTDKQMIDILGRAFNFTHFKAIHVVDEFKR